MDQAAGAELEHLTERLQSQGWAAHVTVERLLKDWSKLSEEIDDYQLTVDDYTNELTASDGLQLVIERASPPLRTRLVPDVVAADDAFKAKTVDDGGDAIGPYYWVDGTSGWWWRRKPARGALAEYLDLAH